MQNPRPLITNLMLTLSSLLFVFLFLEVSLVLFVPSPIAWRSPQELYYCDPLLGHKLIPMQNSYTHSFPVSTNSYGFRDREYSTKADQNTVRILVLGDSLTFGVGVAFEDTYPKRLESMLNSRGTERYEVINAGVGAYDTWQEVSFLKTEGLQFNPNIVVLGLYANDIVPKPRSIGNSMAGCGTMGQSEFQKFIPDELVYFLKRSRLLLVLKDRVGKFANLVLPSAQVLHQQSLLEGNPSDMVEQGWGEVESSLVELVKLEEAHDFTALLIIFPIAEQLLHEYPNAQYPARLKAIADKLQIPYIDLTPKFKQEFKGFGSLFIEWDGHPNARAHAIAAHEIERYYFEKSPCLPKVQGYSKNQSVECTAVNANPFDKGSAVK